MRKLYFYMNSSPCVDVLEDLDENVWHVRTTLRGETFPDLIEYLKTLGFYEKDLEEEYYAYQCRSASSSIT